MNLRFAEISKAVGRRAHAVVLLDQACWHATRGLNIADNITLLSLPPRCPELNAVETVWQFLRDNWLSNRVVSSYQDILGHCCYAWNSLVDQPWRHSTGSLT
jgi:transposase